MRVFVAKELVEYIDKNFATKADRSGRVITGLSMGGHGGMWLSIRHQDILGGGGSMSGGLDIRPFPDSWNMRPGSVNMLLIKKYGIIIPLSISWID